MDSVQYEALRKMFSARRLMPWIPEHELFIKGELARLKVTDEHDYETFKEFYDKKLEEHLAKELEPVDIPALAHVVPDRFPTLPEPVVEEAVAPVEPPKEEEVKEKPKKKPKKKSK